MYACVCVVGGGGECKHVCLLYLYELLSYSIWKKMKIPYYPFIHNFIKEHV